jgi:hypothetical protein
MSKGGKMFDLTMDTPIKELHCWIDEFLNKYGFGDGDHLSPEEEPIVEHLTQRLVDEIGIVENRWKPCLICTISHNPYYVGFENLEMEEEMTGYYEMNEPDRQKIERRLDEIFGMAHKASDTG